MKIGRLAYGVSALVMLSACARAPEATPPAASSHGADLTVTPTAEASEAPASPEQARPAPAPAPAPQGLDGRAQKSKAPVDEEFTNLEAAERALNQAKADLDRLALAEPTPVVGRSASADRATEKKEAKGAQAPSAGAAANAAPNPVCENACRAFSSLSRAAGAVCRLDGNSGAHCTRAKRVVADSQQRVATCACPSAGD